MIRMYRRVQKALCDACGAPLSTECQENEDGSPSGVHHGKLENHFGYGSDLDGIDNVTSSLDLCDECYKKCFLALGIPLSQHRILHYHLRIIGEQRPVEEGGKGIYYVRGYACKFCGWKDLDHGLRVPNHTCEPSRKLNMIREEICAYCKGHHPEFDFDPFYSERDDAWIHLPIVIRGQEDEPVFCAASPNMLEAMQKGERIDPDFKKRLDEGKRYLKSAREMRKNMNKEKGDEPVS